MPRKLSDAEVRRFIKTATGETDVLDEGIMPSIPDVLAWLFGNGRLDLPFDPWAVSVLEQRVPVFAELRRPRSLLLSNLYDRGDETMVVVDSLFSGKDAVFFVRRLEDPVMCEEWTRKARGADVETVILGMKDDSLVIASSLLGFVRPREG